MTRQDRAKGLQTTRPRADGPTRANRGRYRRRRDANKTQKSQFPPRVEFDNYKASYLRM
jgi:hypothetical protein